jgi:hypothetical protein
MIHVIKGVMVEQAFQLTMLRNVAANVAGVVVVREVAHPHFILAPAKFVYQESSHGP